MGASRKKHKFNVIDAVIIIIIFAVIAVAVLFFRTDIFGKDGADDKNDISKQTVSIEYEIQFRSVRDEFADNFIKDDEITDISSLSKIGRIIDVYVEDAVYNGTNLLTGEVVTSDYEGFSNVTVTVSANAIIAENGRYYVNGTYDLSVGTPISVRTPHFTGTAYCINIRQLEGEKQ